MRLSIALSMSLAVAITLPALAAKDKTKGLPPASNTPEVSEQPVNDAKSKLAAAQGKLERAQDAQTAILAKLRKEAEASPAVAKAQEELRVAQSDYDSSIGPTIEKVRASREYDAAVTAKKAAAQKLADLQAQNGTPQDDISAAAKVVLEKGHAVTKLEATALAADPKIAALKAKLDAANVNLLKARHDAEQAIKTNSELETAKKDVETARAELPPLQAALASAKEKYNADLAARDKAAAASGETKHGGSTEEGAKPKMRKRKV